MFVSFCPCVLFDGCNSENMKNMMAKFWGSFGEVGGESGSRSLEIALWLTFLVLLMICVCSFVLFAFYLMDASWKTRKQMMTARMHNWGQLCQKGEDVVLKSDFWLSSLVSGFISLHLKSRLASFKKSGYFTTRTSSTK
jgi:hypothetical protein